MDTVLSRHLYDKEWVQNGCPESGFDPLLAGDDEAGTIYTDYLIWVVATICSVTLLRINVPVASYFFVFGLSYGLGGFAHHAYAWTSRDDHVVPDILFDVVAFTTPFAHSVLNMAGFHYLSGRTRKTTLIGFIVSIAVGFVMAGVLGFSGAALFTVLSVICMLVIYTVQLCRSSEPQEKGALRMKVASMFVFLCGQAVFGALRQFCGPTAYEEDCFQDCPLPQEFNHNAVFHMLVAVSCPLLAWGERKYADPVASIFTNSIGKNGEIGNVLDSDLAPEAPSGDRDDETPAP